jgi:hypothetical protein
MRDFIRTKLRYWTETISAGLTSEEEEEMLRIIKRMSENALAETKGDL